jgi:hypothetical protein
VPRLVRPEVNEDWHNDVAMAPIPSFDAGEVELLVSAVEKTLEHLRAANERLGVDDPELMETGRRYAILLQKLQAVTTSAVS